MSFQGNRKISIKRDQYRVSIRKQQMEKKFQEQRTKFKEEWIIYEQSQISEKLNTHQKRQEWIHQRSIQFAGYPNCNWKFYIINLLPAILHFQEDFSQWIESGLISRLCEVFKFEYQQLKLCPISARILLNILCVQNDSKQVVKQIIQHNILIDINNKVQNHQYSLEDCSYLYSLLVKIGYGENIYTNMIIKNGGMAAITSFAKKIIVENCKNKQVIKSLYNSMQMIALYNTVHYGLTSITIEILSDFFKYLGQNQSQEMLLILLDIANTIVKKNRTPIFKAFFNDPILIGKLLDCLLNKSGEIRLRAITFFAFYLSSNQKEIGQQLLNNKFLQILKLSYEQNQNLQNKDLFCKIINQMLICISNLVCDKNPVTIDLVVNDQLMKMIITFAHFNQPKTSNHEAIYCINNLISYGGYRISKYLQETYSLTDVLALNLQQSIKHMSQVKQMVQIINCIGNHICNYKQVVTYSGNKIINTLESIYNYSIVIQNLYEFKHSAILQVELERAIQLLRD